MLNLTRFHGVFAPNSQHRPDIIIQKGTQSSAGKATTMEVKNAKAMSCAARLKRAFHIDIR